MPNNLLKLLCAAIGLGMVSEEYDLGVKVGIGLLLLIFAVMPRAE